MHEQMYTRSVRQTDRQLTCYLCVKFWRNVFILHATHTLTSFWPHPSL